MWEGTLRVFLGRIRAISHCLIIRQATTRAKAKKGGGVWRESEEGNVAIVPFAKASAKCHR